MARPYGTELTGTLRFRAGQPLIDTLERKLKMRQAREPDFSMSDLLRELVSAAVSPPRPAPPRPTRREIADRPPAEVSNPYLDPEPQRYEARHEPMEDGMCMAGCQIPEDLTCLWPANDPRRPGNKRKKRA